MPFPNEHACRLRDPGDFQPDSFRRMKQGRLSIIVGRLKGKTTTTAQAYRYPKDEWSADAARKHCSEAGGSFEAAKAQEMSAESYLDPIDNPMIDTGAPDFSEAEKKGGSDESNHEQKPKP